MFLPQIIQFLLKLDTILAGKLLLRQALPHLATSLVLLNIPVSCYESLKCLFQENLLIPIENYQKKDALIRAAQYRMSDIEIRRRKLTGTLASASLASLDFVKHGQQLSQDTDATSVKYSDEMYEVHIDSKYFEFPQRIEIPKNCEIGTVALPFKFKPDGQGFYPSKLLLVSSWDIRQYELEVTVTPSTTDAEIRFNAPALQSITQDIPIVS